MSKIKPEVMLKASRAQSLDDIPWGCSENAKHLRQVIENYDQGIPTLKMRPYQEAACAVLMALKYALLADEMGLGKTPEAICAATLLGLNNILVVAPKSTVLGWQREIKQWCGQDSQVALKRSDTLTHTGWNIVPWSLVADMRQSLCEQHWDLVIIDEAHFAKNTEAKRTRAVYGSWGKYKGEWIRNVGLAQRTGRLWCLTGTPIKNKPIDMYPTLHALHAGAFAKSKDTFGQRYCYNPNRYTPQGYDYNGAMNLKELSRKLRSSVMMRRVKSQVLQDLPELQRQIIPLQPNAKMKKAIKSSLRAVPMESREKIRDHIGKGVVPDFTECSAFRREEGLTKVKLVVDYVEQMFEVSTKPLVIGAYHKDVIEGIAEKLNRFVAPTEYIHGSTSAKGRDDIVKGFQSGRSKILVISIPACGTGMNGLQEVCDHALVAELDWSHTSMSQFEARFHRFGQKGSVLIEYLIVPDQLDAYMTNTILDKSEIEKEILE